MTVIRLPPPDSLDRIRDERVREAARRYEEETGRRLVEAFGNRLDDELVELFLILNGYGPEDIAPDEA